MPRSATQYLVPTALVWIPPEAKYGSLGHSGYHDWHILQKRYLSCLLFEYVATLGMIDLAYVEPWQVPRDYSDLWGTDDLSFLSRYDGLLWLRLNPLGAYCLDTADGYQPQLPETNAMLAVLPSLQIKVEFAERFRKTVNSLGYGMPRV
jgi:hypothetical protein